MYCNISGKAKYFQLMIVLNEEGRRQYSPYLETLIVSLIGDKELSSAISKALRGLDQLIAPFS